jgi:hypothetical protein
LIVRLSAFWVVDNVVIRIGNSLYDNFSQHIELSAFLVVDNLIASIINLLDNDFALLIGLKARKSIA